MGRESESSEVELMGRYCDGDPAAFHALYTLVAPRLLSYLIGLCRERATAEDLLQQTFLKLHQARSAYIRGADLLPWLYTIAHRTFLDEARRRKSAIARLTREEPAPPRADITGVAEELKHEPAYAPSLATAAIEGLQRLPHNQREALLLTKVHGRSVAEAAAIAGTTPGAIKLRAHRGYVALRRLLADVRESE